MEKGCFMNIKELKEWLWSANKLNGEIEELDKARQKAFSLACGKRNGMDKQIAEYIDYSNAIDDNIKKLLIEAPPAGGGIR